ncbi:MAG: zinc ribbon domain-containing protein, partial [Alphaproteobacteria bacterium]|nr:zinc ribbon domain-containing protein [Alphaproteobacteria bacterium]
MVKFCPECGKEPRGSTKFCPECGFDISSVIRGIGQSTPDPGIGASDVHRMHVAPGGATARDLGSRLEDEIARILENRGFTTET